MGRDASETRERLLDAAEHLFARRGVRDVPIREINALAEQRNASALHYHFGSREGLLVAVFERQQAPIDAERLSLLAVAGDDVRSLTNAFLAPLADRLLTSSGRNYLRIIPEVLRLRLDDDLPAPTGLLDALRRLDRALRRLPAARRRERLRSMTVASASLLADRAARVEDGVPTALGHRAFVDELVSMASALLQATGAPAVARGNRARR